MAELMRIVCYPSSVDLLKEHGYPDQEHPKDSGRLQNGHFNKSYTRDQVDLQLPRVSQNKEQDIEALSYDMSSNHETLSTVERQKMAVVVTDARKAFKGQGGSNPVLKNFCMTVRQGTIYGLLGSSGCGKTTLLNCIVGLKHLDAGTIMVFGEEIGTSFSRISGKNVGFMPQETALYKDFTIHETITYFGSLHGMRKENLLANKAMLVKLLSLPEESRRISSLSGGQVRRVSLACALIHTPPLLILDEPTVGVDPILRDNIWQYLKNLVLDGKSTVIITTHYLDEARSCDTIGVLRGGRLLTENSPKVLFEKYKTSSLEDVVLLLCQEDEDDKLGNRRLVSAGTVSNHSQEIDNHFKGHYNRKHSTLEERIQDSVARIKSLIMKNGFVMTRNISLLMFAILLPSLQALIMSMSMGNDPKPIELGVVNHDFPYAGGCGSLDVHHQIEGCNVANLSCQYLRHLPGDIELFSYNSEDEARSDIKAGKIRSFVTFPANYSEAVYERATFGLGIENETLQMSIMTFEMDASNAVITKSLQRIVYETYQSFVKGLLMDCGQNPDLGGLPIKFQNPIYGRYDLELSEFIATGTLASVVLLYPLCTSSITYIWDKKQGTMERARVAGTQTFEIMISYFVTEGITMGFQVFLLYLILIYVFKITIIGSTFLAIALLLLNGYTGITLGLLIASFCTEEIQAMLIGLAIMFPNICLAGILWPLEGMPVLLKYFSYVVPGTLANEAFRSIVVRGWGFTHFRVWTGFASTFAWLCLYWVLIIVIHRLSLKK